LHPNGFLLMYAVSAVIALGLAWPWLSLRGIDGELAFEQSRGREGQPCRIHIKLRNRFPWPVWGLFVSDGFACLPDRDAPAGRTDQEAVGLAALSGRSRSEFVWEFVPEQRGEYPLRPPALTTAFPFGLWQARRPLPANGRLLVWPRVFAIRNAGISPGGPQFSGDDVGKKPGHGGDFLGVRTYRRGDSLRRIHWAKTAMHDRLMVREQQALASRRVQLVLDNSAGSHLGAGPDSSLERAVRAAASLIDCFQSEGAQLETLLGDRRFSPANSRQTLFDALARLRPAEGSSLRQLLATPAVRRFSGELQVVVTGRAATSDAAAAQFISPRRLLIWEPAELAGADLKRWLLGDGQKSDLLEAKAAAAVRPAHCEEGNTLYVA
jgi:uncharacterized protein (DUF58 family)